MKFNDPKGAKKVGEIDDHTIKCKNMKMVKYESERPLLEFYVAEFYFRDKIAFYLNFYKMLNKALALNI